ncbi:lipopolysaccharide biosynthesis protein [Pontibacter sp. KCTC 32443]|uniref:lipopolysaccharide biosynthesis protein n=1 Tax=Pontibacter TaxID=323449 RepID=UPI00164D1A24|nr:MULTISPECIES: lipopolysaccharide biosynthesis protein [Pontibacter]MBC5772980.1 lipopolysaccharide biosynthesis protein [Pontibacter sp. KCTC 32443]
MSDNLASKAVNGIKWGSASTIANAVMQIGYTAIMARILSPEAFGLVAIAGVIIRFGSYFANLGLNKAVVQQEELTKDHIRAAFTSSAILGLLFTGIIWAVAPIAAMFFKNPDAIPIVRAMAFAFLISGLSSTALSLLERNMQFKAISILETVSYIISYLGAGITLAYLGFGVWSLIYATLLQMVILLIGAYAVVRHNILFTFDWQVYKPLFSYGSRMSLISFLEFLSINLDTILIGRFLGDFRLGIYNRSRELISQPMHMLTRTIIKVMFPSFSKLQSDNERLGKAYLSSITFLATLIIPVCFGILVAAPEIVALLLGDKWIAAVPVLQILCLGIPLSFITMFAGMICDAKAALNSKIVLNVAFMVVISIFFFLFKGFGLLGFASAIVLGELVKIIFYQKIINRELNISYRQQISVYLPGVINGSIIAVAIYVVSSLFRSPDVSILVVLLAQILTGAILLAILTLFFPHKLLRADIGLLFSKLGLADNTESYQSKIMLKYKNYLTQKGFIS